MSTGAGAGPDARKLPLPFAQTASVFTLWDFVRFVSQTFASRKIRRTHGHSVSYQAEEPDSV